MTVCRFSGDAARHELTPVDNLFIAEYLPFATGLQVQVYIYGLMQCHYPSMGERPLTEALGLTEESVLEAFCYWQEQGLVRILSDAPLTVEYCERICGSGRSVLPAKYAELVRSIHALTAPRQFGMQELKHVYDWIEVFCLEEGAVLELISHCMDSKGRRVSVNYMSRVAQSWAERGIRTFEDAKAYLTQYELRQSGAAAILRAWNKRRRPTEDEIALYRKWTGDWGFTDEAIRAALPRLTVTGSPNFTYLDELLADMHGSRITEAKAIEADDEKTAAERAFAKLLFERAGKAEPTTRTQRAQINMYLNDLSMPRELLLFAADRSRGSNEPFGQIKRLLNDWHEHGISTVSQAEAYLQEKTAAPARPARRASTYKQRELDDGELARLLEDLSPEL